MDIGKFIVGLKFKSIGKAFGMTEKLGKTDFGILKVAFMVAALDGEVTDAEYAAFETLAKRCRGYTPEGCEKALVEAMRSAGYLMLLSRRVRSDEALVNAFIAEAKAALPNGFAYCSVEDVRGAFVTWVAMGMSDGDYSARERACIEALRRAFAEMKVTRMVQEEARWEAISSAYRTAAYGGSVSGETCEFVTSDFVSRVERLVSAYDESPDESAKALESLVGESPA